jgi:hypothetical protein
MSYMREAHREAVVEAFGEGCAFLLGFDEVQEGVAKVGLVLRR